MLDRREKTAFSQPVQALRKAAAEGDTAELQTGDRLGAWTLAGELGQGGMGRVYLAERSDGHYNQRAAIKLLAGWSTPDALAQLARERQILAGLSHPHIARLIDGGSTPRGRPYLVMEFVDGQRIDRNCEARSLDATARLALFEQVCAAVAYAHGQLVVHCDIKPGNVLVGADGRAMLLDFGIAHLQGQGDSAGSGLTPRYASPEQQAGEPATTASDIFSLGRLLDELIKPLGPQVPRSAELQAIVTRATARQPGQRYGAVLALQDELHRFRQHLPLAALPHGFSYVTAKLVRRRWPWLLVGAAATAMAALFTLRVVVERDRAVGAELQARAAAEQAARAEQQALAQRALAERAEARAVTERDQAEQARQQAQAERDAARAAERQAARQRELARASEQVAREESDTSRQVSDLLVGLFEGADPAVSGQPDVSSVTLVDRGRERINEQLGDKPQIQARMQGVLGRVYESMGRQQLALELYDQALAKETRPDNRAQLLARRAMALANANQNALAVDSARQAVALREAGVGSPRDMASARDTLGHILTFVAAYGESGQQLDRALQARRQLLGPAHLEIASTLHHQGMLAAAQGQFETAELRLREALAMKRSLVGPSHLSVQTTQQVLAATLASLQRLDEAEQMLQDLLTQRRKVLGPDAMPVAMALNELAGVQQDSGQLAKAIASYRETIAIQNKTSGPRSARVAVTINNLATALEDAGDPAAEAAYRESLEIRQATLPAADLGVARVQHNLGRWLLRAGRLAEAGPLLEQGAATRAARLAPQHTEALDSTLTLAEWALRSGQVDAARQRIDAAAVFEPGMRATRRITLLRAQGLLLAAQGQAGVALLKHRAAADLARQSLAPGQPAHQRLRLELAMALWTANGPGDRDAARQALPTLLQALQALPADAPLRRAAQALAAAMAVPS